LPPPTPPTLPSLGDVSTLPDAATQKGLNDFTGSGAENRVLHINVGFFKYGTDDKAHAGAMVLSIVLLVMIALTGIAGLIAADSKWPGELLEKLGTAFTFVAGVAIGQGLRKDGGDN